MTIESKEYSRRRAALLEQIGVGGIALLAAAPERVRSRDVHHEYRQDSDFYYLTGFTEPRSLLVLAPGREEGEAVLFCQPKDPQKELWEGAVLGPEAAPEALGVDQAFPIERMDAMLPKIMTGRERIFHRIGGDADFDGKVMGWARVVKEQSRLGGPAPKQYLLLDEALHEMRLFKSEGEIRLLREAARISATGHRRIMGCCRPGMYEYELEAELLHTFLRSGSRPAYGSIVGAGDNACVLHYTRNTAPIADGDLVLVDAGCEFDHYAADITRTFPANGRFSAEQREIYEIVLRAQDAAIAAVQPGAPGDGPQRAAVRTIVEGLLQLGLLSGTVDEAIESEAYKPFYMHRVGHWLGIDVHDVGSYRNGADWRPFEPGMVTTIEPGIYIAPDNQDVPARWRGIGVRIEDDVLVTGDGRRILSEGIPRGVAEIEAFMARG